MLILGYSVVAYACFLASSVWAVFFLAGGVDHGATVPAWQALAIDGALLLAFAAQHSVMARPAVKRHLTRLIPPAAERSTYVLIASLLLFAQFAFWQPLPAVIWDVDRPWSPAIWVVYAAGWLLVVWSTYMVDHADFLGLRQAWTHLRRLSYAAPTFTERYLYAWLRHPMMLGLLIAFWATPHLSAGHLFFAIAASGYIAVGIRFEERDLRASLGPDYAAYAERVPALVPRHRRRAGAPAR
ncbi:isoprenylcysteine carboxylmethyltransferase family protein [Actinoplanes sp. NPDC026619]|uniref:methyltransferase family protein n=1 Tax=Actinoplanes sp. NPDC026619 TaxID=3155798 RepID=UPI0033D80785